MAIGDLWLVPPLPRTYDEEDEAAFMNPRRTPQPLACFAEPVRLARPLEDFPFERTYIRAVAPDAPSTGVFAAAAQMARTSPAWKYREIATSHMVASNRPRELSELLIVCGE
jgi:hypothetical protein